MKFSDRSVIGFCFSIIAYVLLFFWPGLLSLMIWVDYGIMPGSPAGTYVNRLYYDFMIVVFPAETVWLGLLSLCLIASILFSGYLHRDIRPSSLGDWQPLLLHSFFIGSFGFLNFVTVTLMSLAGWAS